MGQCNASSFGIFEPAAINCFWNIRVVLKNNFKCLTLKASLKSKCFLFWPAFLFYFGVGQLFNGFPSRFWPNFIVYVLNPKIYLFPEFFIQSFNFFVLSFERFEVFFLNSNFFTHTFIHLFFVLRGGGGGGGGQCVFVGQCNAFLFWDFLNP